MIPAADFVVIFALTCSTTRVLCCPCTAPTCQLLLYLRLSTTHNCHISLAPLCTTSNQHTTLFCKTGVPRRQSHRRSGLPTLPSVGAIPQSPHIMCSFSTYMLLVGCFGPACKNRRPYNLYCVGGDVKPCSISKT